MQEITIPVPSNLNPTGTTVDVSVHYNDDVRGFRSYLAALSAEHVEWEAEWRDDGAVWVRVPMEHRAITMTIYGPVIEPPQERDQTTILSAIDQRVRAIESAETDDAVKELP